MRALVSVWDKTGLEAFARGPQWPGLGVGLQRRHVEGAGRVGDRPHVGRGGHRIARDARRPGQDPAPQDPRWHPRRPLQARTRRRPRSQQHHGHRPRRLQPLSVPVRAQCRADRHRRPHHGAGRGQEPRARRGGRRPGRLRPGARRVAARRRVVRRHSQTARPRRVRPHRGLRRRHRRLARRRRRTPAHDPHRPRAGPRASLRREPAPARRPLSRHRHHQLVGRPHPARGHGPVVPQPLRRRGRLAARARPGARRHGRQ